jgi:hypothetical protein
MNRPLNKPAITVSENLVTADASKVSATEFLGLFAPKPDPLHELVRGLWKAAADPKGNAEEIARLRAEIALTAKVERELRFTIEQQRAA